MAPRRLFLVTLFFATAFSAMASAGELPTRVGACVVTTIASIQTRLVDGDKPIPGSGSSVSFANGGYQVSYDTIPAIEQSRVGDHVRMCFLYAPTHCPKGDDRGKIYRTTNLRTKKSWRLPDSEHSCGGA